MAEGSVDLQKLFSGGILNSICQFMVIWLSAVHNLKLMK